MGLDLKAKLSLDTSGFTHGMNFSKAQVQNWNAVLQRSSQASASRMKAIFAGAFGAVAAGGAVVAMAMRKSLEESSHIQDLADRVNMSAEAFQQFSFAAKQAGSSPEAVITGMQRMAVATQQALGGNKELEQSLARLGFTVEDLRNKSIEELFRDAGEHIRKTKIDAELLADVLKVFGKGGGELIPVFKSGKLGGDRFSTSSNESIKKGDVAGDLFDEAKGAAGKVRRDIFNAIAFEVADLFTFGRARKQLKEGMDEEERKAMNAALSREEAEKQEKLQKEAAETAKEREKTEERIKTLNEQLADANKELSEAQLDTAAKKLKFLEQEKEKAMVIARNLALPEEQVLAAAIEATKIQKQIEDIKRGEEKKGDSLFDKSIKELLSPASEASRAGNFLGASGAARQNVEMFNEIRQIRVNTGKLANANRGGEIPLGL